MKKDIRRSVIVVLGATVVALSAKCGQTTVLASEIDSPSQTESFGGGYVISEYDYNTPTVVMPEYQFFANPADMPAAYPNVVNEAFINSMPANRNQTPYGTCWAFASVGLAEFDLIHDSAASTSIDLSELALAYFNYHSVVDPLGGTEGDRVKWNDGPDGVYTNPGDSYCYLQYGGSFQMSVRRYAQWCGLTSEAIVPYSQAVSSLTDGIPSEYAYLNNVAYMENAYFTNIKTNPELVKQQVLEHGAVGITYYDANFYRGSTTSDVNYVTTNYYVPSTENIANGGYHAVMIVGWDDNYSRENFGYSSETKPPSDGAWLVRNSWGTTEPYFWISYCDPTIADSAVSVDFVSGRPYDNNYQFDGGMNTYKVNATGVANVFKIKEEEGVASETLKAISLSMTQAANVSYTIDVYSDVKNSWNPKSGTLVSSTSGSTLNAGVYTISLEQEVELAPGKMSEEPVREILPEQEVVEEVVPEPEAIPEPVVEEATPPMPDLSDPNRAMSPDEIAALFANLGN